MTIPILCGRADSAAWRPETTRDIRERYRSSRHHMRGWYRDIIRLCDEIDRLQAEVQRLQPAGTRAAEMEKLLVRWMDEAVLLLPYKETMDMEQRTEQAIQQNHPQPDRPESPVIADDHRSGQPATVTIRGAAGEIKLR